MRRLTPQIFLLLLLGLLQSCSDAPQTAFRIPSIQDLDSYPKAFVEQYRKQAEPGSNIPSIEKLAHFFHANQLLQEAQTLYTQLLETKEPKAQWAYLNARAHQDLGSIDEAIAHYKQSIAISPTYPLTYLYLGDLLSKSGDPVSARKAYQTCLEQEPEQAYALLGLSRLAIADKKWDLAKEYILRSLKASPGLVSSYSLLSSIQLEEGNEIDAARSRQFAEQGERFHQPEDPWLDEINTYCLEPYRMSVLASMYLASHREETGIHFLKKALEIEPENARLTMQLAKAYRKVGQEARVVPLLKKAITADPSIEEAHYALISSLEQQNVQIEALNASKKAIRALPKSSGLWRQYGVLLTQSKQLAQATQAFEKAVALEPNEWRNQEALANHFWANGLPKKAIPIYETTRNLSLLAVKPRLVLATHYLSSNQFEMAYECIQEAVTIDPEQEGLDELQTTFHLRSGNRDLQQRKSNSAEAHYRAALKTSPQSIETLTNLSMLYLQGNRLDDARKTALALVAAQPTDPRVYRTISGVEMRSGQAQSAIHWLKKGLSAAQAAKNAEEIRIYQDILKQVAAPKQ